MSTHTSIRKKYRGRLLAGVSIALCLIPLAGPAAGATAESEVARGITALHLFEYEDANEAFRQAQQLSPRLALAYWGEAMTYWQTLWRREDVAAGRAVLAKLGSTAAARAGAAGTPRDRALIEAVNVLFGDGDADTRHRGYAEAMGRAHAAYPDDPDVASFYALALLGTMSRGLIGYDAHEGHTQGLAGSDVQQQAATILQRVLAKHPEHPGALHYLIHDYDDPAHARLGLDAARALAKLAPPSSHARHMPSHIFVQLGMWSDAAASDRSAYEESKSWVERKHYPATMRSFHALSWLEYELLQSGRYNDAWNAVHEMEPVAGAGAPTTVLSDFGSMRARFVVETRRWGLLARSDQFANANDLFAIGMSAAHMKDLPRAERVRQFLASRAQAEAEGDLRPAIAVMEREVAALIAAADGRSDDALDAARSAASAELKLPPPLGLPAPIKPAPELLGEMLLEKGQPREALDAFNSTLQRSANRSLSVLGAARAASAAGDVDTAKKRYAEFLANYADADADLAEIKEAREAIARPFDTLRVAPSGVEGRLKPSRYMWGAGAIAFAGVITFLTLRRRTSKPRPALTKKEGSRNARTPHPKIKNQKSKI